MRTITPYKPSINEFGTLTKHQSEQLSKITSSTDGCLHYYPCQVTLNDGQVIDNVYIVDAQEYINKWGVWPSDDSGKHEIELSKVGQISDSPNRIPPNIANLIYKAGESGMGYCIFTLKFKDGTTQAFGGGGAIDFVQYPKDKSGKDIQDVLVHEGRNSCNIIKPLKYFWCLHGKGIPNW
jgi:hypothetical protein